MAVSMTEQLARHLQSSPDESRGRTILMVLYLCVLTICFVTPLLYYCRLRCEERYNQHLRDLEAAGIATALEESQQHRDDASAARRKYREERRARILQLFAPVRMTLKEEHFVPKCETDPPSIPPLCKKSMDSQGNMRSPSTAIQLPEKYVSKKNETQVSVCEDVELGHVEPQKTSKAQIMTEDEIDPCEDDDAAMIRIPIPGLHYNRKETRLVPGMCTICLCVYEPGSDIVWSSNSSCDHVFHRECIETWLMKQREGPLCPCCRRDFVIDPFDVDEENDTKIHDQDIPSTFQMQRTATSEESVDTAFGGGDARESY